MLLREHSLHGMIYKQVSVVLSVLEAGKAKVKVRRGLVFDMGMNGTECFALVGQNIWEDQEGGDYSYLTVLRPLPVT